MLLPGSHPEHVQGSGLKAQDLVDQVACLDALEAQDLDDLLLVAA